MISYAQNYEDVMLRRVFRDQKDGFYIDVGAMDPVEHSVTKYFYDEGWCGINVEPNEWFYNKLLEQRPRDINLDAALGEREESRTLYVFEQYGISTFDEASRDRFVGQGFAAKQRSVKITTLAALCTDYVKRRIDFLKVDCEGWEEFVLKGADWDRFRPRVVIVEATEPGTTTPSWSAWEPFLSEIARYEMVYFDGLNRFYVPLEHSQLRSCFEAPPNVFDGFRPYAEVSAEHENRELSVRAEQAIDDLGVKQEGLKQTIRELEAQINAKTLQIEELGDAFNSSTAKVKAKDAQVGQLQAHASELESERCGLLLNMEEMKQKVQELEENIQTDAAKIAQLNSGLAAMGKWANQLEEKLLKSRLWIGRLSQDLVAGKRR